MNTENLKIFTDLEKVTDELIEAKNQYIKLLEDRIKLKDEYIRTLENNEFKKRN